MESKRYGINNYVLRSRISYYPKERFHTAMHMDISNESDLVGSLFDQSWDVSGGHRSTREYIFGDHRYSARKSVNKSVLSRVATVVGGVTSHAGSGIHYIDENTIRAYNLYAMDGWLTNRVGHRFYPIEG